MRLIVLAVAALTALNVFGQRVVVEGDSLFQSNNGESNWTQFFTASGDLWNNAEGGHLITNIISEFPVQDAPLFVPGAIFILQGGVGDLGAGSGTDPNFHPNTGAQVYSNAMSILTMATNAGFSNNFLCTVCPSSSISSNSQRQERTNYNALVRGGTNNGYRVLDTDRWIAQDTNDTRYYQPDGIHWTSKYEAWLGLCAIPDAVGFSETAPELSIGITNGVATMQWTARENSTNSLEQSDDVLFTDPQVTAAFVESASEPLSVNRSVQNHAVYFRVRTSRLDFPTFHVLYPSP